MKYFAVRPGVFFGGEEGLCVTMGKRFFFLKSQIITVLFQRAALEKPVSANDSFTITTAKKRPAL